jgi:hypothetical protein
MAHEVDLVSAIWGRFIELVSAPLINQDILWFAIPLGIATLFMTLYFGKYKQEELGWNTAFGNTMVFIFVAIDLIREMYYSTEQGSFENLFSSTLYVTISGALVIAGLLFMLITYYHLLPRKWAFILFSNPPVNLSLYVVMTIVYTNVAADWITVGAAIVLFFVLSIILRFVQWLEEMSGREEGITLEKKPEPGEVTGLAEKFKKKSEMIKTKKMIVEKAKKIVGKEEEEA